MENSVKNPWETCIDMDISIGTFPTKPVKQKRKKISTTPFGDTELFHGINPQWKFIDEKYFDTWKKNQINHKERLKRVTEARLSRRKEQLSHIHNYLQYLAGPKWYQELSPQQKEVIDNLKITMKMDLDSQLTGATRTGMSFLGLTPMPTESLLWKCLKRSYGCPVEFLLLLYRHQQKNKEYSINDRLLLSGVAHLTLMDTLKEMHLRSPSPPRKVKKIPPPKPKPKKKKYSSVYLMPNTFKWKTKKTFTEYKNPFMQKPRSPYFSYTSDMIRERLVCKNQPIEREDDQLKIPCDLFKEHLDAEDYYNHLYGRSDTLKYILPRPHAYETCTPKIYPGLLPIFMVEKKYPPPIKLSFEVKIYNERNTETNESRKVLRTVCEARSIPAGRPSNKTVGKLLAKYTYKKDIGAYLEKNAIPAQQEVSSEGYLYHYSVCLGPEEKIKVVQKKYIDPNRWIKRPKTTKKKRKLADVHSSDYMLKSKESKVIVQLDEEALKTKEENKKYLEAYKKLFANIEQMEKLRVETGQCVCPEKTKNKAALCMDCTCAIWNLPAAESLKPKFSCECNPPKEEIQVPNSNKCDCKKKAKEKMMEACEKCGHPKNSEGNVQENIHDCENCIKQTPMKFPPLEDEKERECECAIELADQQKEMTIGYVLVNSNQPENKSTKAKKSRDSTKTRKERKNNKSENMSCQNEECLRTCGKLLQLDHCQKEAMNLLNLLKCDCMKCRDIKRKYRAKYIRVDTKQDCCGTHPVIASTFGYQERDCNCLEKYERRVKALHDYKKRMKAKLNLKSQKHGYIISGVQQTPDGPIFNVSGVIPKKNEKKCVCLGSSKEQIAEEDKRENVTEKLKKGYQYTITGLKEGLEGKEYVLGTVKKESDCEDLYKDFMDEHNECLVGYGRFLQRMNKEIRAYMEEMKERYENPPLTGKKLVEEELKRMLGPKMPEGKSEFVVSGVVANAFGKSFILGGVLLDKNERTECTVAVESYTHLPEKEGTSKNQRTYQCNYMTFGKECNNPFETSGEIEVRNSSEELICRCISYESISSKSILQKDDFEEGKEKNLCACECPCGDIERPSKCTCAMESKEECCICAKLEEQEEEEPEAPDGCTCGKKSFGPASDACVCDYKNCGCQVGKVCVKECFYGPMEAWWSRHDLKKEKKHDEENLLSIKVSSKLPSELIGGPLKKYVILEKMPKTWKKQKWVLKKLLNGLGEDGYPLAQLPECYLLPHFRLWMQFRRRVRWNYEDSMKELRRLFLYWDHIESCLQEIPPPALRQGLDYTWAEADFAKKMIYEKKQKYYNAVRKQMVDHAREFYASLSPYKFPNPPYLNHYFYAYQPAKIDHCLTEYVWSRHEHKNPLDYTSCLCD